MSDLGDLYQEVILDHNRSPRNFRVMADATSRAEGFNPLCGDRVTVYLKTEGGRILDISFQGSGCAISKSSASVMTDEVKGKNRAEVEALFQRFHHMVTGSAPALSNGSDKLSVFSGVSAFPARVKCAVLAWHTLKAALDNKEERVSTE